MARPRTETRTNTFLTIDTADEGNPFVATQESFINETDVSTYPWVSAYAMAERDGPQSPANAFQPTMELKPAPCKYDWRITIIVELILLKYTRWNKNIFY